MGTVKAPEKILPDSRWFFLVRDGKTGGPSMETGGCRVSGKPQACFGVSGNRPG